MNKQAIFGFIKKNIVSLTCGLVAIAAIVLLFYPLGGMVDELTTNSTTHAANFDALKSYLPENKPRKLPISDPFQTDSGTLPGFPNTATIAVGNERVELWKKTSELMMKNLTILNQQGHSMLVPDELPLPIHDTTPFHFAQVYRLVLSSDPTISGVGDPVANPPVLPNATLAEVKALNLQNDILHGALPPTPEEILKAKQDLSENDYEPRIVRVNGKAINLAQLNAEFAVESAKLPQKMKAQVAKKYRIYVEKDAFALNASIVPDAKAPIQDIWYAQMQLWIQQDLATAIAEANADSTSILDAPVKRLIMVQIPTPDKLYVFPPPTAGAQGSPSGPSNVPATGDDKTAYPPNYSLSVTGRYSNGMYDVVRFGLVVDVDAARVNQFIESLSNKRQIAITDENEYALNPEFEASRGYLYGPGSTVRLELAGEMLFLRSWTKDLMPDQVKLTLGLIQPKPGLTPGMPTGGGMMDRPPGMGPGMPPGFNQPPHP